MGYFLLVFIKKERIHGKYYCSFRFFSAAYLIVKAVVDNHLRKEVMKKMKDSEIDPRIIYLPIQTFSGKNMLRWGVFLILSGILVFLRKMNPDLFSSELIIALLLLSTGLFFVIDFFITKFTNSKRAD